MAKRTELKCPYCDTVQMRVKNCKEAELLCHNCGASLRTGTSNMSLICTTRTGINAIAGSYFPSAVCCTVWTS